MTLRFCTYGMLIQMNRHVFHKPGSEHLALLMANFHACLRKKTKTKCGFPPAGV